MPNKLDLTQFDNISSIAYKDFNGEIKEIVPQDALAFSSQDIPFETQAITYYTVSQLMEQANFKLESYKLALKQLEGKLYLSYVDNEDLRKKNNNKKPTDAMVNAAISSDDSYIKTSKAVLDLQEKANLLKNLFKAFEQRKDLMQSVAAQKRAELNIKNNTVTFDDNDGDNLEKQLMKG